MNNSFVTLSDEEMYVTDGGSPLAVLGAVAGVVGAYAGLAYLVYALGVSKGKTDAYHDGYRR